MRARALALYSSIVAAAWAAYADSPTAFRDDLSRLPAAAADLYRDTTWFPRQAKWRRIPWMLDLNEGIRRAKEEKRPLLLWTSGDDPLERC